MRKHFVAAATVAVFALLVTPAFAAPGGNGNGGGANGGGGGGKVVASISFMGSDEARVGEWTAGDEITFAVDPVGVKDSDLYHLWVKNTCSQDGVNTYVQFLPVTYASYRVGAAGIFTLSSPGWTTSPAECTAFVWNFTKGVSPLAGATLTYAVS